MAKSKRQSKENETFVDLVGLPSRLGGFREGSGAKPIYDAPLTRIHVGVTDADIEWLEKWNKTNRADAVRQVFERAKKFWPNGV